MQAEFKGPASDKAIAFVTELEALCTKHGIQLSVEAYDALELWPLKAGEPPIHAPCFEDMTLQGKG